MKTSINILKPVGKIPHICISCVRGGIHISIFFMIKLNIVK